MLGKYFLFLCIILSEYIWKNEAVDIECNILPRDNVCFGEHFEKGTKVVVVVSDINKTQSLEVHIRDKNNILHSRRGYNTVEYAAPPLEEFTILYTCINNMGDGEARVRYEYDVGMDAELRLLKIEGDKSNLIAENFAILSLMLEKVGLIELSAKNVNHFIEDNSIIIDTIPATLCKCSIIGIISMIFISFAQIVFMKSYLRKKKII